MKPRLTEYLLLGWGIVVGVFFFGFFSNQFRYFPYNLVNSAIATSKPIVSRLIGRPTFPYLPSKATQTVGVSKPDRMAPGMTLISAVGPKGGLFAELVDSSGHIRHYWNLDWFKLWDDAHYLPKDERPHDRPGTNIHGIVLSPNGDLTFNYEWVGMMQVDFCDRPKWHVERQVHHSVFQDEQGNFWTSDYTVMHHAMPDLPNYKPPFWDYRILEISPTGKIIRSIRVFDLLRENNLTGSLYLATTDNDDTTVEGDTIHVNDVEVFPSTLKPDVFRPGDVMVSMRNISTIMVFDPRTEKARSVIFGHFVRQHDPDFVDGSHILVFDNNNIGVGPGRESSRIVKYSVKDGGEQVMYEGTPEHPFFSKIMGKVQSLSNGDLLLTEAMHGRALEVTPAGETVWEFNNLIKKGIVGLLGDAQRIPPSFMSEAKVDELAKSCPRA